VEYTIKIKEGLLRVVMTALGEMPLKETYDAFVVIQSQVLAQEAKAKAPQPNHVDKSVGEAAKLPMDHSRHIT
jgi:hypothetical protein